MLAELFYAVRALTAAAPYDAMRDRFEFRARSRNLNFEFELLMCRFALRMGAARKKGERYEELLDKQMGRVNGEVREYRLIGGKVCCVFPKDVWKVSG